MDKKEQIEKLEQELRFLQESLEAAVVSKEEFERGKKRIESRLDILRNEPDDQDESQASSPGQEPESNSRGMEEDTSEANSGEERRNQESQGAGFRDIKVDAEELIDEEPLVEKAIEGEGLADKKQLRAEVREIRKKPKKRAKISGAAKGLESKKRAVEADAPQGDNIEPKEGIVEAYTNEGSSGFGKGFVVIIILVLAIYGGWWLMKGPSEEQSSSLASDQGNLASASPSQQSDTENQAVAVACSSDKGCVESGRGETCRNPGTSEASCEAGDVPVKVTIISDPSCAFCETARMKGILREIFPMVSFEEFSKDDAQAQELIGTSSIISFPAYIFGADVEQAKRFSEFKRALEKVDGRYVVTAKASGAPYFFKRNAIALRLEVYLKGDTRERVLANVQPVLDLLKGKISFVEHVIDGSSQNGVNEFSISSFPTFIINNQMKFSGIQSPETLKEKFCTLNKLPECSQALTESIQ